MYAKGNYWGVCTGHEFGKSANKGTPQLTLYFDIKGAVNPADPDGALLPADAGNVRVYMYFTDNQQNQEIAWEQLERLGWLGTSFRDFMPDSGFTFVGKEIELYNAPESYQGKMKDRFNISGKRSASPPLEGDEVMKLDRMFESGIKHRKAQAAKAAQAKAPPAAAPLSPEATAAVARAEADIPF